MDDPFPAIPHTEARKRSQLTGGFNPPFHGHVKGQTTNALGEQVQLAREMTRQENREAGDLRLQGG
jgi:hypothetical protein